jgi:outer membrane lipoprotein-sorting protein
MGAPARVRRGLVLAGLLVGLVVGAPVQAAPLTLEALMAQLAQVRRGEARFVEQRHIQQLERTLEYSGRLSFVAPDVFVRETLSPRPEKLAVDGNVLTMTSGGRSRTLALDATPEAQMMVEAIRGTLTGDRAVLERHFSTQTRGSLERWTLELVPRSAQMRGQVSRVVLQGRLSQLREVQVLLADGDDTVMQIEPVAAR